MKTLPFCSFVTLLFLLPLSLLAEIGSTSTPTAAWEHSPSTASNYVARYEIHFGPAARTTNDPLYERGYTGTNAVSRLFTSAVLTNVYPGIWYLSVIAVGTNGIPSLYSNEVCYTNRGEAPINLRILGPTEALRIEATAGPAEDWKTVIEFTNSPAQRALAFQELFRGKRVAPPLPP